AQAAWSPPAPKDVPGVPVVDKKTAAGRPAWTAGAAAVRGPRQATWPAAGRATVVLDRGTGPSARSASAALVPAGNLPVKIGRFVPDTGSRSGFARSASVGTVSIDVRGHAEAVKAGSSALLMSLSTADGSTGPVTVQVDYSSFAHAYGGDYASRLKLVELPQCALSTPDRPDCRAAKSVRTSNDPHSQTLTTDVSVRSAPM